MAKRKIISRCNSVISAFLFYFVNKILSHIPFHFIRDLFYSKLIGKIGQQNSFLMGLELRAPKNIIIGNNNIINRKVLLDGRGGKLIIGNNVNIAQEVVIWTLSHDPHDDYFIDKGLPVIIEDYAWIGHRAVIMPGVKIGYGAVIAACSLVNKNVEPMSIVGGVPAKKIIERGSLLKYKYVYKPYFE
jgi:acetyltransferase-like isoleucine patch superfamily enzyme